MANRKITFRSRARLLQQLGDQLIRNEQIALTELVKNAYDADASVATVRLIEPQDKKTGSIVIEDDGVGMDAETIQDVWLEIGSDFKEKILKSAKRSVKYKRLPIGEKGIGRFGVHKLGNRIKMTTRRAGEKEVVLEIDWNAIQSTKYLEDLPIKLTENAPAFFTGSKTGTRIEIGDLKNEWDEASLKEIVRAVHALHSPFESAGSFRTDISVLIDGKNPEFLGELVTWGQIKDHALYKIKVELDGKWIAKFRYSFEPLPGMKKLRPKTLTEKDKIIADVRRMVEGKNKIDLARFHIGKVRLEAYVFTREDKILKLGVQEPKSVKSYLDQNGGVRVFREGMRVYDYGEPGNDWLGLDSERVNRPGKKISNSLIVGAVFLDRESSSALVEKTNREGFVENDAYKTFRDGVSYAVGKIADVTAIERNLIRKFYSPTKTSEPVLADISELKQYAEKNVKKTETRKEILKYLKRIEDGYQEVNEILLRSAGAGLTMGMVIHEIEKITKELKIVLNKEVVSDHALNLVKSLTGLIEGYSALISKTAIKDEALKPLIERALEVCKYRFKVHGIELTNAYDSFSDVSVRCAKSLFMSAFVNIVDNSIWWLEYSQPAHKKIYVGISKELKGHTTIIIADNGPGFSLPTDKLTEPFISTREGGMGLGLHIVKEVMTSQGGLLLFPEKGDFTIPPAFTKGAVVALAFKNKQ